MKKILTLIIFAITINCYGQTYHPFPDSSASWIVLQNGFQIDSAITQYFINGDTLVNGKVYSKVYQVPPGSIIDTGNSIFIGGIREDTNKTVYVNTFIDGACDTTELLLYKFGLNIGDTIQTSCFVDYNGNDTGLVPHIVNNIDSVLISGEYRKRYEFQIGGCGNCDYWIEGIGSLHGLFYPFYGVCFELCWELVCFEDNEISYNPWSNDCYTVGIKEKVNVNPDIKVLPNPLTETITIILNNESKNKKYKLNIYDIKGTKLGTYTVEGLNKIQLDLSRFNQGVYFLQIRNNNNVLTKKVIKF